MTPSRKLQRQTRAHIAVTTTDRGDGVTSVIVTIGIIVVLVLGAIWLWQNIHK